MIADLEPAAEGGDPQAQYELFTLYHDLARRRLSWSCFDRAEALLRSTAQAGLPAAAQRLADVDALRYAFTRCVERSTAA